MPFLEEVSPRVFANGVAGWVGGAQYCSNAAAMLQQCRGNATCSLRRMRNTAPHARRPPAHCDEYVRQVLDAGRSRRRPALAPPVGERGTRPSRSPPFAAFLQCCLRGFYLPFTAFYCLSPPFTVVLRLGSQCPAVCPPKVTADDAVLEQLAVGTAIAFKSVCVLMRLHAEARAL